ncbi:YfdQ family protein [Sphingopyxis indica]|uniref:DUF2303 family protein n=1 Tax=Sphingopyxis indica TaxID=436663 RepID=UPI002939020B|nr:DUF2303 family protein [Sphingopyxis indica]WOF43793.1 YfdQ family protein [Sphingopyxis indica]
MADKAEETPRGDLIVETQNSDIGPVIAQVRALVDEYTVAKPVTVTDPRTGTEALAYISGSQILPLPSTTFDGYLKEPRSREGTANFTAIDSLVEHVNRFKDDDSVLFAVDDRSKPSITAVLDYHRAGDAATAAPRFGRHRSIFAFPISDEWKAWQGTNRVPMKMSDFAAFLEDRIVDVLDMIPDEDSLPEDMQKFVNAIGGRIASPSRLLELSVGLKVHEKAAVSETVNLSSGEGHIRFTSEHVDDGGAPLKVPNLFLIAIPVFKNGAFYRIAARLRYRKTSEGLLFWYELWREDRVFDHAFREACLYAQAETDLPLLFGTPE